MAKLNVTGCGHGNKTEAYAGGIVVHYNVFPNGTPADRTRLAKVQKAFDTINKLDKRINLTNTCNVYFKALPKGKSFRDFWRNPTIFINYDPTPGANIYGDTHSNDKDIALHRWCTDTKNVWMIAATNVHEFAHIGGAPASRRRRRSRHSPSAVSDSSTIRRSRARSSLWRGCSRAWPRYVPTPLSVADRSFDPFVTNPSGARRAVGKADPGITGS
jgi:hypothetical protein